MRHPLPIVLIALLASLPAVAQEETAPSPLAAETERLAARVETLRVELDELGARAEAAEGDARLLLHRRMAELRFSALADLHSFCDAIVDAESDGESVPEARRLAVDLLTRSSPRIQALIDRVEQSVREHEGVEGLETTGQAPSPRQEERVQDLLDLLYRSLLDHAHVMEGLELDADAERAYLADRLRNRAESLAADIGLRQEQIESVEAELASQPGDAELTAELSRAKRELANGAHHLRKAVALMGDLDIDTSELQQLLIQATGEITPGLLTKDVAVGLLSGWTESFKGWLAANGPKWLLKVLLFLGILFVFRIFARFVRAGVERALARSKLQLSQLLRNMIVSTAYNALMLLAVLIALSQVGVSLGPLLAGLGIAGFIVGFALQDTLGNFASGIMILLYRPYDVGDLIDAGGVFGKVSHMSLVSTTFLTLDNQTLVVPNSKIWGDVIKNVTAQTRRRIDLVFGIGYADDIEHAERVFREIVESHPKVLKDPEPVVKLHTLGESSVDFVVRPWVETDDYWEVYWDITRAVKLRLDEEGITIPFPQRDVHLHQVPAEPPTAEPRIPGGTGPGG